jgi:hypothetical protein
MKIRLPLVALSLLFLAGLFVSSFANLPSYRYEGASRCSFCHSATDIGDQYDIWSLSAHRRALSDLSSEKGATIAREKGIKKPTSDPACLSCHLTGYNAPFNLLGPLYRREDGVSCEGCHGAGGGYSFFSIMHDEKKAVSKGLIVNSIDSCVTCHDGRAHAMPPFDPDQAMKRIAHPIPGLDTR